LGIRGKACKRIREFLGTHYEKDISLLKDEETQSEKMIDSQVISFPLPLARGFEFSIPS
jgi:hypothetical protein